MKNPRFYFDLELLKKTNKKYIIGIDEVGWGCIAGDLVLGACCIDKENYKLIEQQPLFEKIKDSKKISEKNRILLDEELKKSNLISTTVGIGSIDLINSEKLARAYSHAIDQIAIHFKDKIEDSLVLIDGNRDPKSQYFKNYELIVKGDDKSLIIGIASNIAKNFRDSQMIQLDQEFPEYHLAKNKGYGTEAHVEGLKKCGLSKIHRIQASQKILSE